MNKAIKRIFEQVENRFHLILSKGIIHRLKDGEAQVAFPQGGTIDEVPMIQQYGFKSLPPKGSIAVLVSDGTRRRSVIVGTKGPGPEPTLADGEACIFGKDTLIKAADDQITLKAAKFKIGSPTVDLVKLIEELLEALANAKVANDAAFAPTILKINGIKVKWGQLVAKE